MKKLILMVFYGLIANISVANTAAKYEPGNSYDCLSSCYPCSIVGVGQDSPCFDFADNPYSKAVYFGQETNKVLQKIKIVDHVPLIAAAL